jgi:endonuclease
MPQSEIRRPFVWQMIREAIDHLNGVASYAEIRDYIHAKWGDVNDNTITAQIVICRVNHRSRVHYPENKKPRRCDSQYDFLFNTGCGRVERYDPEKHGDWELTVDEYGNLAVRQDLATEVIDGDDDGDQDEGYGFALESHLRDFIAKHLPDIRVTSERLALFEGPDGHDGIEYPTGVGPIDILAVDSAGNYVVFELKVGGGPDRAVGQILRYMGWVRKHLAADKRVSGVIVAREATEKLKYAVSLVPSISVHDYRLRFELEPIAF